jgi:hypothetical protein
MCIKGICIPLIDGSQNQRTVLNLYQKFEKIIELGLTLNPISKNIKEPSQRTYPSHRFFHKTHRFFKFLKKKPKTKDSFASEDIRESEPKVLRF